MKASLFHKDPVEIGPVNAGVAGCIGDTDGIGIVVFQIFFCFLKVDLGGFLRSLRNLFFHKGKERQKISRGRKLIFRALQKRFGEFFHLGR